MLVEIQSKISSYEKNGSGWYFKEGIGLETIN